ncbi:MAG TPA: glycosyltransferase [Steroidobacteraceae bacterium]|nr:glycosyltransferase [Steroidobacteraceae bacterium]
MSIDLSVVIPIYNESAGLQQLFARLYPALDKLAGDMNLRYELIMIDDGSRDDSPAQLREQFNKRPDVTRIVLLAVNAGQHMAIKAGFERTRGSIVVTLDADLQNPPEEIHKLIAKMREGHDYVGGYRRERNDTMFRKYASRLMNRIRERTTRIRMRDQGCMLRAYSRVIVDAINHSNEVNLYIPALAFIYSRTPAEVEVEHEERAAGESKYPLSKLVRLNFDLMTGFSLMPLQFFSMLGMVTAVLSTAAFIFLAIRRMLYGSDADGVFTLFSFTFMLLGVALFGMGLLGEYIGRIYQQVQSRPRYMVHAVLEQKDSN